MHARCILKFKLSEDFLNALQHFLAVKRCLLFAKINLHDFIATDFLDIVTSHK